MKITDEEILKRLEYISQNAQTKQERRRAHALILSNNGKKSHEIAEIFGVSQRTVFNWFKDFKAKGLDSLPQQKGRGRKAKLSVEKDLPIIKKYIEAYPNQPKKAYALTLEEINIDICYETFKNFLKKHCV